MTTQNTCSDCRHYGRTNDLAVGECRRYPPTLVPINGPQGIGAASMRTPVGGRDPACGEFSLDHLRLVGTELKVQVPPEVVEVRTVDPPDGRGGRVRVQHDDDWPGGEAC